MKTLEIFVIYLNASEDLKNQIEEILNNLEDSPASQE